MRVIEELTVSINECLSAILDLGMSSETQRDSRKCRDATDQIRSIRKGIGHTDEHTTSATTEGCD